MRLDLHVTLDRVYVTLDRVTAKRGRADKLLVALEYVAIGQPDVPRLYDFYNVEHEVAWQLLARTAQALGVQLGAETFTDAEACCAALQPVAGTTVIATIQPDGLGDRRFLSVLEVRAVSR